MEYDYSTTIFSEVVKKSTMRQENVKDIVAILMNSPLYLTLSLRERYGIVMRLIQDYPLLANKGDTNLKGSSDLNDHSTIVN